MTDDLWLLLTVLLAFGLGLACGIIMVATLEEPRCSRACCQDQDDDAED